MCKNEIKYSKSHFFSFLPWYNNFNLKASKNTFRLFRVEYLSLWNLHSTGNLISWHGGIWGGDTFKRAQKTRRQLLVVTFLCSGTRCTCTLTPCPTLPCHAPPCPAKPHIALPCLVSPCHAPPCPAKQFQLLDIETSFYRKWEQFWMHIINIDILKVLFLKHIWNA